MTKPDLGQLRNGDMLCADAGQAQLVAQGETSAAAKEKARVLVSSFIKQHFDKLPPDQVTEIHPSANRWSAL